MLIATYSIIFIFYLLDKKRIRCFLLKESTLKDNNDLILSAAYKYFLKGDSKRKTKENIEIFKFIKSIKEYLLNHNPETAENESYRFISQYDSEIFHVLVATRGFEYVFGNYTKYLYSTSEDKILIQSVWTELKAIEFYPLDICVANNYIPQLSQVLRSKNIKNDTLKEIIIFNIIYMTSKNLNIIPIREELTTDLVWHLFNVMDSSNQYTKLILSIYISILKHLVFFNNDYDNSNLFITIVTKNLLTHPITNTNDLQIESIMYTYIMSWVYLKIDTSIDSEYQNELYKKLIVESKLEFTNKQTSLIKIFRVNLYKIIEKFSLTDFKELENRLHSQEYFPTYSTSLKTTAFSLRNIIKLYFLTLVVANTSSILKFNLFALNGINDEEKSFFIKEFLKMFDCKTNNYTIKNKECELIYKLSDFLKVQDSTTIQQKNIYKNLIMKANDAAKLLKEKIMKKIINVNSASNNNSFTIKVDNSKLFGGNSELNENKQELGFYSLGINNRTLATKDFYENNLTQSVFIEMVLYDLLSANLDKYSIDNIDKSSFTKLLQYINENQLFNISNRQILDSKFGHLFETDGDIRKYLDNLHCENQIFFQNECIVAINDKNFCYKLLPFEIIRHKLTDDEVTKFIDKNIKISKDTYKLEGIYYTYSEVYNFVKKNYLRDEVHVYYYILKKTPFGTIIIFK